MRKVFSIFALIALFAAGFVFAQQSGKGLLEQGRAKKTAGDLQGAMEAFETVVADFATADRNAAANALLELGGIADSLGQLNRARGFYDRVRNDFKDQSAEVEIAANRLKTQTSGALPSATGLGRGPSKVAIRTPFTEDVYSFALSPDGETLVFQVTTPEGKRQLWRQAVDSASKGEPIAGTEGAGANANPFFSPDGKSVVFFAKQKLWQVALAGGTAKELADAAFSWGGAWAGDSIIVADRGQGGPLELLQDGRLSAATPLSGTYVSPHFIDDRRFLYYARDARGGGTIEVHSLDGPITARGLPTVHGATYTKGFLLYATAQGVLNALRLDLKELGATGPPMVVSDRVGIERRYPGIAAVAASVGGSIAYREKAVMNKQMMWMDRSGELLGTVGSADSASPGNPRVSPDGRVVLHFRATGAALGSIWATDTENGAQRQIQDGANAAVWSANGDRILFAALQGARGGGARAGAQGAARGAARGGGGGALGPLLLERPITAAAGSGAGTQVGPTTGVALPEDWASTGAILYRTGLGSLTGGGDLFAVPPNGGTPVPIAQTLAAESHGRFSPNGNWIAYQSDEGGRNEVYVQPFPGTASQRQRVSLNGGTSPQWGRGGQELYFISGDNRLMVATAAGSESAKESLEFATPKPLFRSPLPQGAEYDTARGGDRFLILAPIEEPPPIVVLTNWIPGN